MAAPPARYLKRQFSILKQKSSNFLLLPTAALIGGIWWQESAQAPLQLLLFLSCASLLLIKTHKLIATGALFFFSGALLLCAHEHSNAIQAPRALCGAVHNKWHNDKRECDVFEIDSIQCTTSPQSNIEIGDVLLVKNTPFEAPAGDYGRYLHRAGITHTAQVLAENITLLHRPAISFARLVSHIAERLQHAMQSTLSTKTSTLLSQMFLGVARDDATMQNQFLYGGVSHLLARSGLHVALYLLLWQALLTLLPLPLIMRNILLALLAMLYGLLTSVSISFVRALSFFVLYQARTILGRDVTTLHLLFLLCLCMLLFNPYHVFFLDFELTFALTSAFAFAYRRKPYAKTHETNA